MQILSNTVESITTLKNNPIKTVANGDGDAVAILSHNKPVFYCLPTDTYEEMLDTIEDMQLLLIAKERENEKDTPIKLEELKNL